MGAVARPPEAAAASGSLKRELGATLALGWPVILANVAIYAMTATDFIMLGRLSPQALAAGALSLEEPLDTPYGDRRAMVRDPFGKLFASALIHKMRSGKPASPTFFQQTSWKARERLLVPMPSICTTTKPSSASAFICRKAATACPTC